MNQSSYRLIVFYFSIFSLLILISGALLFVQNIGTTPQDIRDYYLGSEETFTNPKSLFGLLEHIYPHLAGMSILLMVIAHFLIFTKDKKQLTLPSILLFITLALNLSSPLFIINNFDLFVYIKGLSFIIFSSGTFAMTLLVISHLIKSTSK